MPRPVPFLLVFVATLASVWACGKSHPPTGTDAGTDGSSCPPAFPETCVRSECCDEPQPAERIAGTCDFRCPEGLVSASLCEPSLRCDFNACTDNSDCVLAPNTCCGPCGTPTLADFDAVHRDQWDAHSMSVCPEPEPCPECALGPNPGLGATCDGGRCRGFDLATLPLTECERDADCRLRVRDCCVCGSDPGVWNLIAIRTDAETEYTRLVCPALLACDECVPPEPTEARAACVTGRCTLERTVAP